MNIEEMAENLQGSDEEIIQALFIRTVNTVKKEQTIKPMIELIESLELITAGTLVYVTESLGENFSEAVDCFMGHVNINSHFFIKDTDDLTESPE